MNTKSSSINQKKLPKGISLRADGLYMGRVTSNGKTYSFYDRDLKVVQERLEKKRFELKYGVPFNPTEATVDQWFHTWIDTYKRPSVKVGTLRAYQRHYSAYIKEPIGNLKMKNISGLQLQLLLNGMSDRNLSMETINLVACILSCMFKQARKINLIRDNPYESVTIPHGRARKERVVFTREQQAQFLSYAKGSYLRDLFHLAIFTGMRNGELRGLQWTDVDFEKKVIHVQHTLLDDGTLDTPKTRTSLRDIPMMPQTLDVLKHARETYLKNNRKVVKIKNDDFVFSVGGRPINKQRVTMEIERILARMEADGLDFPYFTLHTTRHTFATRCIEGGMEPQTLKAILGHSSLSMTMDLYAHVLPDAKIEAMSMVSNAF